MEPMTEEAEAYRSCRAPGVDGQLGGALLVEPGQDKRATWMTWPAWLPTRWAGRDARDWQIAVLSCLLTVQLTLLDFGASLCQAAVMVSAALGTQVLASALVGRRSDWRSPLVTGLSLSLLLRTQDPVVWVGAGMLAIGSKYLLRIHGRHVFNPACLAIVVLVMTGRAWVSPGQWGALAFSALLLGGGAVLVLGRARRVDTAAAFLGSYALLLFGRAAILGDPWAIPLHQMQSGALLVFALFMVTDPRTTPAYRAGRIAFAALVAVLAYALQYGWQVREGLFYALALLAPAVPFLDHISLTRESPSCAPSASPSSPVPG